MRRQAKRTHARLREELQQRRERRSAAEQDLSASRRMKSRKDSDARSVSARERVAQAVTAHSRAVAALRTREARAAEALEQWQPRKERGSDLKLKWQGSSTKNQVVRAILPDLIRSGRLLLKSTGVTIGHRDRIRIFGPNGSGKSTLLEALVSVSSVPKEHLLHLPQELEPAAVLAAQRRARSLPPDQRGRTCSLLAALGMDPEAVLASDTLSPGEGRKLLVAEGLARHVSWAVLDEPTNHLDVPSIERLEKALSAFPGALLLVTHDEVLARSTTLEGWSLVDGHIVRE
jgi:ATPase subunit of ABC transporter with duplicated ATPase domains